MVDTVPHNVHQLTTTDTVHGAHHLTMTDTVPQYTSPYHDRHCATVHITLP